MAWTYGIHAVETLLRDSSDRIQELWLVRSRKPGTARERIREAAMEAGIRFRMVEDQQMRRAVGEVAHQGVAARVLEFVYASAEQLLATEGPALIVALDEVQDPHNLGAVIRSAAGLGAAGVVIPRHRSASVTSTVSKVAVGAESRVPVAQVVNLGRFLRDAREAGFWSYAADAEGGEALPTVSFAERSVIVLGSEATGVRPGVLAECDVRVSIPMVAAESLNVSVAAGITMYAWATGRAAPGESGPADDPSDR